jgi:hypothetical protein
VKRHAAQDSRRDVVAASLPLASAVAGIADEITTAHLLAIKISLPEGDGKVVERRTGRLIHRSHELLTQLERMRAEARGQSQDQWLQRAKERAARIASRVATYGPQDGAARATSQTIEAPCKSAIVSVRDSVTVQRQHEQQQMAKLIQGEAALVPNVVDRSAAITKRSQHPHLDITTGERDRRADAAD